MTYVGMDVWFWQCVPKAFSVCLTVKPVGEPEVCGKSDTANRKRTLDAPPATLGGMVLVGSPAAFGKLIANETEKWGKVICAANIKAE